MNNTILIPFKPSPIELDPNILSPDCIFDLVSPDHECRVFHEILEKLDTTSIESQFSHQGQHAYHPKLLVSILIYAYSRGVVSSREIEARCKDDLSFMFIAQMSHPNFRVLCDFRKDHAKFFHDCFIQTVQLAMELKLVSLGHISLDGSKFKANSSKHKAMSYGRLKEKELQLTQEVEALIAQGKRCDEEEDQAYKDKNGYEPHEDLAFKENRLEKITAAKKALEKREEQINPGKVIEAKKQISFADKDARIMGKKGNFDYSYNPQISVDSDHQIIVGQHVSQNANDLKELKPALEAVKEATGRDPDKESLDNGYLSGPNLDVSQKSGIDTYIATGKEGKKNKIPLDGSGRKLVKSDFEYNQEDNNYNCPGGQVLKMIKETRDGSRTYQGDSKICDECPYQARCCESKKGAARRINTDDKESLRQQMNAKMEKEESKEVYKKRKHIVEPVFGQIKNRGFRGFSVRGKEKVDGEFALVCAVHNITKIVTVIFKGVIPLKTENMILNDGT